MVKTFLEAGESQEVATPRWRMLVATSCHICLFQDIINSFCGQKSPSTLIVK